jgi:hypothetical protein
MVFKARPTLTASTAIASVASAALLTAVGLCVPYTERALHERRTAPPANSPAGLREAPGQRQAAEDRGTIPRSSFPRAGRHEESH